MWLLTVFEVNLTSVVNDIVVAVLDTLYIVTWKVQ